MKNNVNYRLELVSARRVKRIPGARIAGTRAGMLKARDFAKKRGYRRPVVLSDSDESMNLLAGADTFEACLEEKETKIPAVIVKTGGEADDLMFALQLAELNDNLNAIAAGSAIVRLIDSHGVSRKYIVETLGKSPAWLNRMENLSRRLNREVQRFVAEGRVPSRSAQEIARLPDDVQVAFAISVSDDFLSKESVTYLVNRYLNEETGSGERDRIIHAPKLALPNELRRRRGGMGGDNSVSARLSRGVARCLDSNEYLSNLLGRADIGEAAIRITDVKALLDSLTALRARLTVVFPPGENVGGDSYD